VKLHLHHRKQRPNNRKKEKMIIVEVTMTSNQAVAVAARKKKRPKENYSKKSYYSSILFFVAHGSIYCCFALASLNATQTSCILEPGQSDIPHDILSFAVEGALPQKTSSVDVDRRILESERVQAPTSQAC
jgi:hypothetical protein